MFFGFLVIFFAFFCFFLFVIVSQILFLITQGQSRNKKANSAPKTHPTSSGSPWIDPWILHQTQDPGLTHHNHAGHHPYSGTTIIEPLEPSSNANHSHGSMVHDTCWDTTNPGPSYDSSSSSFSSDSGSSSFDSGSCGGGDCGGGGGGSSD